MPDLNSSPNGATSDDLFLELEAPNVTSNKQEESKQTPDKYRGKSVDDLIEMHQNAERRLSQQGNELGEVRRLADSLIGVKQQTEATAKRAPERKPITVEALLDNPDKVLEQKLEESSVAQRADSAATRLDHLESSIAQQKFVSKFPKFQEDINNPDFMEWVKKNDLRANLAANAYQQNFDAAASLWGLWEEHKEVAGSAASAATKNQARQKLNQARTEKQGASEGAPAKTYSRAKLMALREKVADGDPVATAQWNDEGFQSNLIQAYAENRVK